MDWSLYGMVYLVSRVRATIAVAEREREREKEKPRIACACNREIVIRKRAVVVVAIVIFVCARRRCHLLDERSERWLLRHGLSFDPRASRLGQHLAKAQDALAALSLSS